jgi:hypothetical protein
VVDWCAGYRAFIDGNPETGGRTYRIPRVRDRWPFLLREFRSEEELAETTLSTGRVPACPTRAGRADTLLIGRIDTTALARWTRSAVRRQRG